VTLIGGRDNQGLFKVKKGEGSVDCEEKVEETGNIQKRGGRGDYSLGGGGANHANILPKETGKRLQCLNRGTQGGKVRLLLVQLGRG